MPHAAAAALQAAIGRYFLPAGPTAANLQQQAIKRTVVVPWRRPCAAYCAAMPITGKNGAGLSWVLLMPQHYARLTNRPARVHGGERKVFSMLWL